MNRSKLTERLEYYRQVRKETSFSSVKTSFERQPGFIRAELRKLTGKKRLETGEIFSAYDAEWIVDNRHLISEGDRLRHLTQGGLLYRVDNIIRNRDKGMNTLQCSKVNE